MPTAIAQHALSSSESNILFETTTTDMAWSSHSTSTVAVSSSTTSGAATSTAPVAADTTSSALFSSLSASSIPHGIDALVVQKENQLICIQKQQRLQQQQQRQLLFRHQQQYQQRQQKSLPCHSSQFGFQQLRNSASVGAAAPGASPHADSCIVLNGSDTTSTSGLSLHSSSRAKNSGGLTMRVDLVDDVWRIIFYILARNCKDLGRSMQVNRRFYSLRVGICYPKTFAFTTNIDQHKLSTTGRAASSSASSVPHWRGIAAKTATPIEITESYED
ncbi:hypothetical protein BC939DRAFT_501830 [Gamsiella multidivaricata]|uniref:uncharacterized protein n=1 Tax=Gamsiella multidivaricata TaxID=101098 RepID=UPI002220FD3B|nr:uncharacterized protein BC939DRAFT_501830 [Gamsiella multidivaricata]KAI7826143.1 hypothetical protein BC939DRAFT_501830 [Gamsiella multidivaricata]